MLTQYSGFGAQCLAIGAYFQFIFHCIRIIIWIFINIPRIDFTIWHFHIETAQIQFSDIYNIGLIIDSYEFIWCGATRIGFNALNIGWCFFFGRMEFKLKFYYPQRAPMVAIWSLLMIFHVFRFFTIEKKNSSITLMRILSFILYTSYVGNTFI